MPRGRSTKDIRSFSSDWASDRGPSSGHETPRATRRLMKCKFFCLRLLNGTVFQLNFSGDTKSSAFPGIRVPGSQYLLTIRGQPPASGTSITFRAPSTTNRQASCENLFLPLQTSTANLCFQNRISPAWLAGPLGGSFPSSIRFPPRASPPRPPRHVAPFRLKLTKTPETADAVTKLNHLKVS